MHDSYGSPRIPPKFIHLWLDKAPMIFLIIAAVAFVIGLNLFAHLSLQVCQILKFAVVEGKAEYHVASLCFVNNECSHWAARYMLTDSHGLVRI